MPIALRIAFAFALTATSLVPAAHARTTLVASSPSQGSEVATPKTLEITFSEPVPAATLSLSLVMTSMPGMAAHKPMMIKGFAVEIERTQATLRFPRPLPTGTYRLEWTISGDAASQANGTLTFRVK